MFIVTARAPRHSRLLLLGLSALAVLALVLLLRGGSAKHADAEPELRAETDEARAAYLRSLGWSVDPEPLESLRLTLPKTMEEPYLSYNRLQLSQGFDLTPYLGRTLDRCTYRITNYPGRPSGCQADLYVCDGIIVAGDVVCTGADGFINTLEFPDNTNEQKNDSLSIH